MEGAQWWTMVHGSLLPVRLSAGTLFGQILTYRFDIRFENAMVKVLLRSLGEVTVATSTPNIYAYIQAQRLGRFRTWTPWSSTCEPARRGVRVERARAQALKEGR